MSLATGLQALLSTAPSLVALQGSRVYPIVLPTGATLPATTFQVVGGSSDPGFETSGPQRRRMQIDHRAADFLSTDTLRDLTREVLDGFTGALPNGFVVDDIWFLQPLEHFDSDARQFRCGAEYYVDFTLP
jgi:hypothetical protein